MSQRFGRRSVAASSKPPSERLSPARLIGALVGAHPHRPARADSGRRLCRQRHVVHGRRPRGQRRLRTLSAVPMRLADASQDFKEAIGTDADRRARFFDRSPTMTRDRQFPAGQCHGAQTSWPSSKALSNRASANAWRWLAPRLKEIGRRFSDVAAEQRKLGFTDNDGLRRRLPRQRHRGRAGDRPEHRRQSAKRKRAACWCRCSRCSATRPSNASSPPACRKPCLRRIREILDGAQQPVRIAGPAQRDRKARPGLCRLIPGLVRKLGYACGRISRSSISTPSR